MIWSLIVSLHAIGGLCGAVSVKFIAGIMGGKKGVICSSCVSIAAAVIMLMSKTANSFEMIIVARILFGYASGLGGSLHMMYLGEISPKKIRGQITLTSANFVSLGKLSGQFFGLSEILGREDMWNVVLSLPAVFSVVQVVVFPFLPESPRHLFIEKGDEVACKKALQSLWGPGEYKQEMDEMLVEQAAIEAAPPKSPLQLLRDRTVWWQLLTMVLIYWFNQLSGMSAISVFSFDIFMESGIPEHAIRYVTLSLGVCEIITSMSSSLVIDRLGRRPLFWGGYGAMSLIWILVTITMNLKNSYSWVSYISAFMIVLIIVSFCGGPGAGTGTLSSEIFIQSDRLSAFAIVGLLRWLAIAVIGFMFPFLIKALGSYSFVLFACMCLLASLYTFFILPETKGKTVLEISQEFNAITVCRKSSPEEQTVETTL
ncbi:solute carrier family 2, facilitated glucose transporter member 9-like [Salarias fasciatus]|uniref:solute carrier family 2, facilitated glucose transporter member 9-like n=1 Tax=Salarias fasciatus TaxID=181472 RepID=UPI001176B9CC|nr:solute carrier family 2, facilitated glucose transporter member 9-like [Salarias fasciatus]